MALTANQLDPLEKIVGKENLSTGKEERLLYSYDATGKSYLPDAVVFPDTEAQVSQILKLATAFEFPVVPRGSGSGMTGGAVPVQGGVVIATSRLNKILEIDDRNFTAQVEPGVIVKDLQDAVEARGLFYPPDPASSAVCTMGGNVAECAGGPKAVKYGVTRDYVLGLGAVLPNGDIIKTGVITAKGVAGYDLTRLIVGSEGTLAFVTRIVVRLLPKPCAVKTMAVFFRSTEQAAQAVSDIVKQTAVPRCVEYLDNASLSLVKDRLAFQLPEHTRAMLILELDGHSNALVNEDADVIRQFCLEHGALDVITASTDDEAKELWQARKSLSPILYKIAPNKINEDIVVPISKIARMVEAVEKIQRESGLTVVAFGHAGDGNIHCNIMYDKTDKFQTEKANMAVDKLFDATLRLGGTITGEHGVGITKMPYLTKEVSAAEMALMKGIKEVFDPKNILNPGKIFT